MAGLEALIQDGMVSMWGESGAGKKMTVTWDGWGNVTVTLFTFRESEPPSPVLLLPFLSV